MLGSAPWTQKVVGSSASMIADADEVRRALELFADPEGYCQVVALKSAQAKTLPGSDVDGLSRAVAEMPGGIGVYFEINPVRQDTSSKASKADIVKRRWIYVDVDPVKDAEHTDNPATDKEKNATATVCDKVCEYLHGRGWPVPVVTDSGNGYGLFWRCDLPNIEEPRAVYKRLLKTLSDKFGGSDGTIDKAVHNADRLAKLPGTWSRKGQQSDDRPHRPCKLIAVPSEIMPVSLELLVGAAGEDPPAPPVGLNGTHDPFTVKATNGDGHKAYSRAALDRECLKVVLARSPHAGGEGRNNTLNTAAFNLGTLIGAGRLERSEVEAALYRAACSSGLDSDPGCGEGGIRSTIASGLAAGIAKPRNLEERDEAKKANTPDEAPQATPPGKNIAWELVIDDEVVAEGHPTEFLPTTPGTVGNPRRVFELHTLKGLMAKHFDEPIWVVPGLLSEGLNILAGKPKMGKSMMALNLGMTVAAGGKALGNIQTTAGDVLYLSLEDRTRRIQSRARKMLKGCDVEASTRLTVAAQWPRQGEGGLELIEWWMKRVKRPTLVIIDVWGKFRPATNQKVNQYTQDYEHLAPLKDLMDRYSCCGLSLLHCRKGASDDVVEDVSGTLGLSGAADGIMVLQRSRNDNDAKVFVTGRDVKDAELALQFDPDTLTWANLGDAAQRATGQLQTRILAWLGEKERCHTFWRTKAISDALDYKAPSEIRPVLSRMNSEGMIQKRIHGQDAEWCYPGPGLKLADVEDDDSF